MKRKPSTNAKKSVCAKFLISITRLASGHFILDAIKLNIWSFANTFLAVLNLLNEKKEKYVMDTDKHG